MEVTALDFYKDMNTDDYLHITLTDEEDIPDAIGKLRCIYPNIMKLSYDNLRTRAAGTVRGTAEVEEKSPMELLREFYELQNNQPMTDEQEEIARGMMEEIWEKCLNFLVKQLTLSLTVKKKTILTAYSQKEELRLCCQQFQV